MIFKDKNDRYSAVDNKSSFEGVVDVAEKGFAFVVLEGQDDIFVSRDNLGDAMDGDIVVVTLKRHQTSGSKREGYIERIVKRGLTQFVGTMTINRKDEFGFVIPDKKSIKYDVFVKGKNLGEARNGQKVLVSLTKYPEKG